ncbi:Glycosyltransferase, DXD sugar-binding motif protein [Akanthomyces lecanii RCEF 1005]|uniref:Glycosyltransferase, DXD sugar-binding motif protein n=1 Tax=Akanthomyces lecanii RCEF 1005 TaxID=1081108 RepID=A0A162IQV2_CORDF|nr:Glycosyltransferase, DXD sugar-binding motif protein [Akanthomyces lecanii RCEF 1005]
MNRRRRFLYIIVLFTVAVAVIYNSYESIGRFLRLFVPHSGYPLNQDQALARFRVQKQQPKNVPRIIHQVLHNWRQHGNESELLPEWETQRQSCRDKNPDWEYKFWTEDVSRDFIRNEFPWFIKTYESFRYPIQREQTVRYFILRHYGGIYIDLDFGCVNSLESLRPYPVFISDHRRGTLADKVLGAAPNHPFWVHVTETIPRHSHWYLLPSLTVLYGTGRWFLTAAWDRWHWDNCQQTLFRYGRTAGWLTRLSMPQWRGAPEWSIFSSHRGGTAETWPVDIFVLGRKHWIVSIVSGVVGCAIGVYLGVKLFRRRCARRRRGYRPVSVSESRV